MKRLSDEGNGIYVIDETYQVVYVNEAAKAIYPELKAGEICYQCICQEEKPCKTCPVDAPESGRIVFYHDHLKQWFEVSMAAVEWPGAGPCHMLLFRKTAGASQNLFAGMTREHAYDEMFSLNLSDNTYQTLFQQQGKFLVPPVDGQLDSMVQEVADHMIHPDDRERFLAFWELPTLVKRLEKHNFHLNGRFRKILMNGEYASVEQNSVLVRQSGEVDQIVLCFVRDLELHEDETVSDHEALMVDRLTGLNRQEAFFNQGNQFLMAREDESFWVVAIDIEHFKLFNDWYGNEMGDQFLIYVGGLLRSVKERCQAEIGYLGGDDFALIMPENMELLTGLESEIRGYAKQYGGNISFLPACGVYPVTDKAISVSTMYDRACIALASVKGNYVKRIAWYDEAMRTKMEGDQVLLSEIQEGLENGEFMFYLQPQYNIMTGRIIGAESLVRWNHPERGVVSPDVFIPLLEKNGLITNLDLYVWEDVCRTLRRWLDEGKRPVPISVNVSRIDIYAVDVREVFTGLIRRYDLDPELLEIEVTESAYSEDFDAIKDAVDDLRGAGFTILMDDFGSGYSSLNMLKDINVDVLKIDTKFLDMTEFSQGRGMEIMETIVRMARMLELRVIAEGVETKAHEEFLKSIGCNYGQGYYYYRPMPVDQFEMMIKEEYMDYRGILAKKMEELRFKDLFIDDAASDILLNNILGGAALYDVHDGMYELLKVNEQYYRVTGCNPVDLNERKHQIIKQVYEDDVEYVMDIFARASRDSNHGAEGLFRRYRFSGDIMWLKLRAFLMRSQDGHQLFLGSVSDLTEQKNREAEYETMNREAKEGKN